MENVLKSVSTVSKLLASEGSDLHGLAVYSINPEREDSYGYLNYFGIWKDGKIPNSFYEANITLVPELKDGRNQNTE